MEKAKFQKLRFWNFIKSFSTGYKQKNLEVKLSFEEITEVVKETKSNLQNESYENNIHAQDLSLENQYQIEQKDHFAKNNTEEVKKMEQNAVKTILNGEKIEIKKQIENQFLQTAEEIEEEKAKEKRIISI